MTTKNNKCKKKEDELDNDELFELVNFVLDLEVEGEFSSS